MMTFNAKEFGKETIRQLFLDIVGICYGRDIDDDYRIKTQVVHDHSSKEQLGDEYVAHYSHDTVGITWTSGRIGGFVSGDKVRTGEKDIWIELDPSFIDNMDELVAILIHEATHVKVIGHDEDFHDMLDENIAKAREREDILHENLPDVIGWSYVRDVAHEDVFR